MLLQMSKEFQQCRAGGAEAHQDRAENHHLRGAEVDVVTLGGSVAEAAARGETEAGSEGSWNGAGYGVNSEGSWPGAGSVVESVCFQTGAGSEPGSWANKAGSLSVACKAELGITNRGNRVGTLLLQE